MRTIEIDIEGRKLPLRITMGALKDYKKLTGEDSKDMDTRDPVSLATLVYCGIRSACRKDGVKMDMELDDFLDSVDMETVMKWGEADPTPVPAPAGRGAAMPGDAGDADPQTAVGGRA